MGREVRRVSADWQHPKYTEETEPRRGLAGKFKPLHEGYKGAAEGFLAILAKSGLQEAIEYYGQAPDENDYMPEWTDAERTHYQMYETCSEGTPISPVVDSPHSLARWLADNGASSFGRMTATYEQWLSVCEGGWAPSAIVENGVLKSGVEAMSKK